MPDFVLDPTLWCNLYYSNSVDSTQSFIKNDYGDGKTFKWKTDEITKLGTYILKVFGLNSCTVVEMTFNLNVLSACNGA